MIKFLAGNEITVVLSDILKASSDVDLAVAYWGAGASKTLGIESITGSIRIICDAYSGACNPNELARLIDLKVNLRTRNGLHTKVYIMPTSVIVGSANASANGLGQEGEIANNVEAAVLIDDKECLRSARDWFESISQDAREVTKEVIRDTRPKWEAMRRTGPTPPHPLSSLLGVLRTDPTWLTGRGIRVVAYQGTEPSKNAKAKFSEIAPGLYHPKRLQKYTNVGELPYYEDDSKWDLPEGEYIVDYQIDQKRGRAIFCGLWQVRPRDAFHKAAPKVRIILLDKAADFKGLRLGALEANQLGRAIFQYVASRNFRTNRDGNMLDVPLDEAATLLSFT